MKNIYTAKEINGELFLIKPDGEIDESNISYDLEDLNELMLLVYEMNTVHKRNAEFERTFETIYKKLQEKEAKEVYFVDLDTSWVIVAAILFGEFKQFFENNIYDNSEVIYSYKNGEFNLTYKVNQEFDKNGNPTGLEEWSIKEISFRVWK